MLLVDLNQVVISNLMRQIGGHRSTVKLDEDLMRHMVLNSLRSYVRKFKKDYGDMVICCDNRTYWRKQVFPFYKANRKKERDASTLDWSLIFDTMANLRAELKAFFPYRVIDVEGAEADDVIATLVKVYAPSEKILILSSDKDFTQLQKYPNVKQYSPILAKFIKTDNPRQQVKEHILRGDSGDGIPNFLSADDTFVAGGRQKPINSKRLNEWLLQEPEVFCKTEELLRNYKRNQLLVDLDFIPDEITKSVLATFEDTKPANRQKLLGYFIEKRLKNLITCIDEF